MWGFPGGADAKKKDLPVIQETRVQSQGGEDPLEKGTATHSSTLAWRMPWTEEPGGLQSMGLQRVGHECTNNTFTFFHYWLKEPAHWKKPRRWERLKAEGGGWMASLTQWTWVWANSGRWWRTGKPAWFPLDHKVRHDRVSEQ